jgi:hypothetical protein
MDDEAHVLVLDWEICLHLTTSSAGIELLKDDIMYYYGMLSALLERFVDRP